MALNENDLATEFYKDIIEAEPIVDTPTDVVVDTPADVVDVPIDTPANDAPIDTPIDAPADVVVDTPVEPAKPFVPEFKKPSDAYIYNKLVEGDEKGVYEALKSKFQYEGLSPEQKALAYIAKQNPGLDDKDLEFIAESEYGIGVDPYTKDELDLLTDEQRKELRKQEINRKKLISEADSFFSQAGEKVELPTYDPFDADPEYKAYKSSRQAALEAQQQQEEVLANTLKQIETTAKNISEINESIEIDLDEGKLPIEISFKLDEAKQKQLVDYVKNYIPTETEVKEFTDPVSGKFDYSGYMKSQATKVFAKDIMKAGMKQALAKDRETFIEKELKNSTLRNNDASLTVTKDFDIVDAWPFGK